MGRRRDVERTNNGSGKRLFFYTWILIGRLGGCTPPEITLITSFHNGLSHCIVALPDPHFLLWKCTFTHGLLNGAGSITAVKWTIYHRSQKSLNCLGPMTVNDSSPLP